MGLVQGLGLASGGREHLSFDHDSTFARVRTPQGINTKKNLSFDLGSKISRVRTPQRYKKNKKTRALRLAANSRGSIETEDATRLSINVTAVSSCTRKYCFFFGKFFGQHVCP